MKEISCIDSTSPAISTSGSSISVASLVIHFHIDAEVSEVIITIPHIFSSYRSKLAAFGGFLSNGLFTPNFDLEQTDSFLNIGKLSSKFPVIIFRMKTCFS